MCSYFDVNKNSSNVQNWSLALQNSHIRVLTLSINLLDSFLEFRCADGQIHKHFFILDLFRDERFSSYRTQHFRLALSHSRDSFISMDLYGVRMAVWYWWGELELFLRDRQKETEGRKKEFLTYPSLGFLTPVSFDVLLRPCVHVDTCGHAHTNVDLTSICTSVLYLFSYNKNA